MKKLISFVSRRLRHMVRFKATLGQRYNKTTEEVKVEKMEAANNAPLLLSFEDVGADTVNDALIAGGTAVLTGMQLRFEQDDPGQSIFFVTVSSAGTLQKQIDDSVYFNLALLRGSRK